MTADPLHLPRDLVDEAAVLLGERPVDVEPLGHSTLGPTRGVWLVHGTDRGIVLKVVGPRGASCNRRSRSMSFFRCAEAPARQDR